MALLAVCALILVYFLQQLLVPFALAGGLAYVLTPALNYAHRRWRWPRALAVTVVYLLVVGVLSAGAWHSGTRLYRNVSSLAAGGPERWNQFATRLLGGEQMVVLGHTIRAEDIATRAREHAQNFLATGGMERLGKLAVGAAFGVILFLVLLFYFLLEGPKLAEGVLSLTPPEYRAALKDFAGQAHPVLLRYVSGLIVIVLFTALIVWVGVGPIFHLPHPWLLALATGVLELIPVAGPTLSAFLLGLTAVEHGGTLWTLAGFAGFCFAVRIGVDQIVGPMVLGRAVRLSPVVVIFAFLAGGMLFGMLGVLLAIPAAAMIKLAVQNYYAVPVEFD